MAAFRALPKRCRCHRPLIEPRRATGWTTARPEVLPERCAPLRKYEGYHARVVDPLAEIRKLFEPAPGTIYLDSATYGLPPTPTVRAMQHAIDGWQAGTADWVSEWDQAGEACRVSF